MTTIESFLGMERHEDVLAFALGRELHGAFGGAFGGVLAAAVVLAARTAVPDRVVAGVDCRFLRSVPAGRTRATVTPVHSGRTVTCIWVDLHDERERLATSGTVSFVEAGALRPLDQASEPSASPPDGRPWRTPPGVTAPIVELLSPRVATLAPGVVATEVRVPWEDPASEHTAEAACVAADMCVGPPVAAACEGSWSPHPNPDVSLRFTPTTFTAPTVTGVARLSSMTAGLAAVGIEVHHGGASFAVGAASSVVLGREQR